MGPDLQTAVHQLQKRLSLLDQQKLDALRTGVQKVIQEMEQVFAKKAELEGLGTTRDRDLDRKVSELYELCHRWTATSAALPLVVARLQSLQALHQESASFTARLAALEEQQDELARLLTVTSSAVQELGRGLQDNMRSLEVKISKALGI